MKVIAVTVYEEVEHRAFIEVPDDFDLNDPSDEHMSALFGLFSDEHDAFQEDVTEREYVFGDAPKGTVANTTLEVE
ncbi:hypothetical protein K8O93_01010 [Gordonia bronchialis]|uniref:hypothetical protein n=1 Tax=Gordonia bronchialis TaxID=2054 RepID=UPI001CC10796|nr:hypothetical protein [Gordonia bronchialis]UAK38413.1 hypothetical protein K8O93_01010 [Gordonia bronchialis]